MQTPLITANPRSLAAQKTCTAPVSPRSLRSGSLSLCDTCWTAVDERATALLSFQNADHSDHFHVPTEAGGAGLAPLHGCSP
jgi:hypothetical protein